MKDITTEILHEWIDQCDSQLKLLEKAKDFVHREYYQKDSITYSVEEDLQFHFGNLIRDHKTKKQLLEKILLYCDTEMNPEMFDDVFEERIVNRLPEYLRKEFYDFVYEM